MKQKSFLISIDTEGDNLWDWKPGQKITTENTPYIFRFQKLCDRYGFQPTYLTNYEMAADDAFVDFAKETMRSGGCEIGMHLHAWNSPPEYDLAERTDGVPSGCPYLIEYPLDIMEQKIAFLTKYIEDRFSCKPISHRAGRWATDDRYFQLLEKYGYRVDCSVTPKMSWISSSGFTNGSCGSDYSSYPKEPYRISGTSMIEVPVTVRTNHRIKTNGNQTVRSWFGSRYRALKGQGTLWLRPNGKNLEDLLYLADRIAKSRSGYLMFMLHSSELMPGGSWRFDTGEKIEKLYADLEILFQHINRNYVGMTIKDFAEKIRR